MQTFPAWRLGVAPHEKFIGTSYSHSLVEDQIVKCRRIMLDNWYREAFPNTRLDPAQNQKHYFSTTGRGMYYGGGILGTITGKGSDHINTSNGPRRNRPSDAIGSISLTVDVNRLIHNTINSHGIQRALND